MPRLSVDQPPRPPAAPAGGQEDVGDCREDGRDRVKNVAGKNCACSLVARYGRPGSDATSRPARAPRRRAGHCPRRRSAPDRPQASPGPRDFHARGPASGTEVIGLAPATERSFLRDCSVAKPLESVKPTGDRSRHGQGQRHEAQPGPERCEAPPRARWCRNRDPIARWLSPVMARRLRFSWHTAGASRTACGAGKEVRRGARRRTSTRMGQSQQAAPRRLTAITNPTASAGNRPSRQ